MQDPAEVRGVGGGPARGGESEWLQASALPWSDQGDVLPCRVLQPLVPRGTQHSPEGPRAPAEKVCRTCSMEGTAYYTVHSTAQEGHGPWWRRACGIRSVAGMLEKTLESPLECEEIKPGNPNAMQETVVLFLGQKDSQEKR